MIPSLVKRGYIVHTRADADIAEALTGKTSRREAALSSGAQFVSTDFPVFEPAPETKYSVALPGKGAARCNPVNAPKTCNVANTFEGK